MCDCKRYTQTLNQGALWVLHQPARVTDNTTINYKLKTNPNHIHPGAHLTTSHFPPAHFPWLHLSVWGGVKRAVPTVSTIITLT